MTEPLLRNEAMLRKVGDYIAAEPHRYDQGDWVQVTVVNATKRTLNDYRGSGEIFTQDVACTSVCCVAGTAAMLDPLTEAWILYDESDGTSEEVIYDGEVCEIRDVGAEVLGLEPDDAEFLFDPIWRPTGDESIPLTDRVRDALYSLADGATLKSVTSNWRTVSGDMDHDEDDDDDDDIGE